MQAKHGLSLETWSAIHGVHTSLLKRMSAAGWDVSKRSEVLRWIKVNGRETTRYVSQPDTRPTPASKLDPKERARARTRENPAVMKFVRRSETSAPSDPAPKPTTPPPKTPVRTDPTLLDLLPKLHYSGPAIEILVAMTPDQIKAAIRG